MALVSEDAEVRPGIDVEVVRPRPESFARDFFTEAERATAERSNHRDKTLTMLWAGKEAVLKSLTIGARVDMRQVQVFPEMNPGSPSRWSAVLSGEARVWAERMALGEARLEIDERECNGETLVVARSIMQHQSTRGTSTVLTAANEQPAEALRKSERPVGRA